MEVTLVAFIKILGMKKRCMFKCWSFTTKESLWWREESLNTAERKKESSEKDYRCSTGKSFHEKKIATIENIKNKRLMQYIMKLFVMKEVRLLHI